MSYSFVADPSRYSTNPTGRISRAEFNSRIIRGIDDVVERRIESNGGVYLSEEHISQRFSDWGFYRPFFIPLVVVPRPLMPMWHDQLKVFNPVEQSNADTAITDAFSQSKEPSECAITLITLTRWESVAIAMPCKHLFERDALLQWSWTKDSCPLCRATFTPYLRTIPLYRSPVIENPRKEKLLMLTDK